MRFRGRVEDEGVRKGLSEIKNDIKNLTDEWAHVLIYLTKITDKRFATSGHGKWKFSERYEKYGKRPSGKPARGGKPLIDTGRLRQSVTVKTAQGNILNMTPKSLEWGSNLEYAERMYDWSEKQGEPFLDVNREEEKDIAEILGKQIDITIKKVGLD